MTSGREYKPKKRRQFLEALAEGGNVSLACSKTGIASRTAYNWRDDDETFRAEWETALETAADALEEEARRRAETGWDEPVYQSGRLVGVVRKYSDTLLIFLLKGIRPSKYRDNYRLEHTGADGKPLTIVLKESEDVP